VFIDGTDASFAAVTLDQSCNTVANYEVWSPDGKRDHGSIADTSGRPPNGTWPELFWIKGRNILVHETSRERSPEAIDVFGFSRDLAPLLLCRLFLSRSSPRGCCQRRIRTCAQQSSVKRSR
jgi:hypothetical protein